MRKVDNTYSETLPPPYAPPHLPQPTSSGRSTTGSGGSTTSSGAYVFNPADFIKDTGDQRQALGEGRHMQTWVSMSSGGLITARTRTWSTSETSGFHGSVIPLLLDADRRVIWPPDVNAAKKQFGVDGTWVFFGGPHDRTDAWSMQVDPASLASARHLAVWTYYDPKNMFMQDVHLLGQFVEDATKIIGGVVGIVGLVV